MVYHGFNVFTGKEDVFVKSERKNITDGTVVEFLNRYQCSKNNFTEINDCVIKWAKARMMKATYELVTTESGYKYHKIEYAGGMTCIPIDDKSAVIIL